MKLNNSLNKSLLIVNGACHMLSTGVEIFRRVKRYDFNQPVKRLRQKFTLMIFRNTNFQINQGR